MAERAMRDPLARGDVFFVNEDGNSVYWIYYNPDSIAGGQYVINTVTFQQICDVWGDYDFWGSLESEAQQVRVDMGTEEFKAPEEWFHREPDLSGLWLGTMNELVKIAKRHADSLEDLI